MYPENTRKPSENFFSGGVRWFYYKNENQPKMRIKNMAMKLRKKAN